MNEPFRMLDPDLQGIDAPPPPRVRGERRGFDTRNLIVHWCDSDGRVTHTTREHIPGGMLIGETGADIADADECWWHPSGKITTSPPRSGGNASNE